MLLPEIEKSSIQSNLPVLVRCLLLLLPWPSVSVGVNGIFFSLRYNNIYIFFVFLGSEQWCVSLLPLQFHGQRFSAILFKCECRARFVWLSTCLYSSSKQNPPYIHMILHWILTPISCLPLKNGGLLLGRAFWLGNAPLLVLGYVKSSLYLI